MAPSYARIAGAAAALLVGLVVLWQAGILFSDEDTGDVDVQPAETAIDTPGVEGFEVGLKVGNVAPDFEFSSLEGERHRLSDFRGSPVLINFWATWCRPCRTEMPAIDEAKRRYADDNVVVLAMNAGENATRARNWLADLGLEFTAFGYDPDEAVYNLYYDGGILGLPISFFVDSKGVITEVVYGPLRESDLDFALEKTIAGYEAPAN